MTGYADISTNLENSRNCLRRIARHDEQQFSKDSLVNIMEKFVKTVNTMDETILVPCRLMDRQVGDSTDIILLKSSSHCYNNGAKDRSTSVHEFLNSADLFNLYNMLNSLKNDLLWTRSNSDEASLGEKLLVNNVNSSSIPGITSVTCSSLTEQERFIDGNGSSVELQKSQNNGCHNSSSVTTQIKTHIRRPSTASMASSNSVSNLSDSESEISNENDSGIESESSLQESRNGASVDKATDLARQCRTHLAGLYRCLEQMTEAANYLTARYQSDVGPV